MMKGRSNVVVDDHTMSSSSQQQHACRGGDCDDESSGSDCETEPAKSFHRRVSTSKSIKKLACIKEGFLMKQTSSFQRWRKRYFKLKSRKLYYGKDAEAVIFDEIDLTDVSIAECSTKNVNHSFHVISPFRSLILAGDSRRDMEEWMMAIKSVANREFYESSDQPDFLSGQHHWYVTSHARPTYCNVCREALSGVTSHGLSCEVCKFKAHKKCAVKANSNCKWTTLSSVGPEIIEEEDGMIVMPHQWLEGNLPVSAKCGLCDKNCGSVLRLQDWRCLWCRTMVHMSCKLMYSVRCPLGISRVSIVPPIALHNIVAGDDLWEVTRPIGCSPLLVFVNSKSGEGLGVKFLRRFKQLLNPAEVYDLMNGGPSLGLKLFKAFNPFRILVCGGDGSVGWVLAEIDKLKMHNQCQIGVLPLGTGNDLARVLGWGSVCDDDAQLSQLLEKYEKATTKMLDRWSIMVQERTMPAPRKLSSQFDPMSAYEDTVVSHLTKILQSDQHSVVISSAKVLCETVKDFMLKVAQAHEDDTSGNEQDSIAMKCAIVDEKLDSLLKTLHEEAIASSQENSPESEFESSACYDRHQDMDNPNRVLLSNETGKSGKEARNNKRAKSSQSQKKFIQRDALMSRANSLKKAVRKIIEHTEKAVDEQNEQTVKRLEQYEQVTVKVSDYSAENPPVIDNLLPSTWSARTPSFMETLKVMPTIESASQDSSRCSSPLSPIPQSPYNPSPLSQSPSFTTSPPPLIMADTEECNIQHHEMSEITLLPDQPSHSQDTNRSSPTATRRISSGSTMKSVTLCQADLLVAASTTTTVPTSRSVSSLTSRSQTVEPDVLEIASTSSSLPNKIVQQPPPPSHKLFPIINPLVSLPMWPSVNKDSLIGKVLLANADALCAAASPLMDTEDVSLAGFMEKTVMNSYFGIGLDAKISLDFHHKREEHPEKCRSRTKNLMWYGMLGGKELLNQTFKNLEQRVLLECDGKRIPLPSLQGIVILNITSYGGGVNFWGGKKENDVFGAPSFADKIMEVVAVFGTAQMAASRVINLQHHRIAQCKSVRITILGEEGVPVQVDGEAWMQPPGYICIVHKNRTQMLCRNRHLESSLKMWQEKQRSNIYAKPAPFTDEELQMLSSFIEATAILVRGVKLASMPHLMVEQYLYPLASQTSAYMDRLYSGGRMVDKPNIRLQVTDLVNSVKQLHTATITFLEEKAADANIHPNLLDNMLSGVTLLDVEFKKCYEINNLIHFQLQDDDQETKRHCSTAGTSSGSTGSKGIFKLKFKKPVKNCPPKVVTSPISSSLSSTSSTVQNWSADEVAHWLSTINMEEYQDNFISHDIQGSELLNLERRDLKELGITKIGHIKRIQQAIKGLS